MTLLEVMIVTDPETLKNIHTREFGLGFGALRLARAPGRVNIIGEHTDYNGLPVLPVAVDRDVAIVFSERASPSVCLTNASQGFPPRSFPASAEIEPFGPGDWGNYAKAAAQALWGWAAVNQHDALPLRGFHGCVGGDIPPGSGLSSSSALVVAVALALVSANNLNIQLPELAQLLADGEQYVGTRGGGMDQTACLLARAGHALRIDFPLRISSVPVPTGCAFVVADSLVKAEKAGAARTSFNTRVVECRLGVQMLRALAPRHLERARNLSDVMDAVPDWRELLDRIPESPLSLESIRAAGAAVGEDTLQGIACPSASQRVFEVKRRCRHVMAEAERVCSAEAAMRRGDLDALGRLMNESHSSCAEDYEISCRELDELVSSLRRCGAYGARLTGAGFGGCAVALVCKDRLDDLLDSVWEDYYVARGVANSLRADLLFGVQPSAGASCVAISS